MTWSGWRTSPLCGLDTETDGTDPESAHIITATVGDPRTIGVTLRSKF